MFTTKVHENTIHFHVYKYVKQIRETEQEENGMGQDGQVPCQSWRDAKRQRQIDLEMRVREGKRERCSGFTILKGNTFVSLKWKGEKKQKVIIFPQAKRRLSQLFGN